MKLALQMSAAALVAMLLSSCGTSKSTAGNNPSGTGPFDSRGNYIEDWADNPSKWKRGGGSVPSKPGDALVMNNDEPPADSIPIPTADNTRQPGQISSTPIVSRPTPVRTSNSTKTTVKTTAKTSPSATAARRTATSSSAASSKPKPKTTVAAKKPAAKKPSTARYTIKKGDTLSAIAARNNTSVAALQRANGIKGSMIQPGKALVIPK